MTAPVTSRYKYLPWLLGGAAAIALAWPLDAVVDPALAVPHNPALHKVAWWCSKLGEGWVPAVAGILGAIALLWRKLPRRRPGFSLWRSPAN